MNIPVWVNSNYTRHQMNQTVQSYAQIEDLKQSDGEPISIWEVLQIVGSTIAIWFLLGLVIILLT